MTYMGGGFGITRGGGGGTLIPTLIFTSAIPLSNCPIPISSKTHTNMVTKTLFLIKEPPVVYKNLQIIFALALRTFWKHI
jgi:hypothetical protein